MWNILGNCGRRWATFGDVNVKDLEKGLGALTLSY